MCLYLETIPEEFGVAVHDAKAEDFETCISSVSALVFAVRTLNGLAKFDGEASKLKRFARTQNNKLKSDDAKGWRLVVPAALVARLCELGGVQP